MEDHQAYPSQMPDLDFLPTPPLADRPSPWLHRTFQDAGVMIDACVLYKTKIVATGEADLRRLLDVFVEDPTKVNLMIDTNSGEFIDPSEPTTAPVGVHMASRTPVSHFAGLLRDQAVHHLVRVTPLQERISVTLSLLGRMASPCVRVEGSSSTAWFARMA